MNAIDEQSVSLWMDTASVPSADPLATDAEADVVVVGSGIAGLSTAYELARSGRSVAVLDRGALAGGMTSRTTAHLTSSLDDYYHELIRLRGVAEARSYLRMRQAAIDRIEEIQKVEGIACDFQRLDGYLFPAKTDDASTLDSEFDACRQIGFEGVSWVDQTPIANAGSGRALKFSNQARFHPRKYLAGLIRCIEREGGRLFSDTPVTGVEENSDGVSLTTSAGHKVRANAAIIATNSPINDWIAVHTKQAPYRTYVVAGRVRRGSVPDALYWDTLDPYQYVRLQPGDPEHDWLIAGGEDHKTGQADDADRRLARLEAWARSLIPSLDAVEYRWSGQVLDPVDHLPYSGKNPGNERVFVHTGDSGEGMTNGVAGSLLLRDLIVGKDSTSAALLDPGRKTLKAARQYVSENLTMATNLAEYLTAGELSSTDKLARGEGAIVRQGLKKIAAYRDERGELHLRSATCTHAGCLLHWNSFETCWDCTCHGSQFSVDGEPLNAPAFMPLTEVDP